MILGAHNHRPMGSVGIPSLNLPDENGITWGPYKKRITSRFEISRKNPKGEVPPFSGVVLREYRWGMGPKFVHEMYSTMIKGYPVIYYVFQHVGKEKEEPLVRLFLFPSLGRWGYEEREDFKGHFVMDIEVDHRRHGSIVEAYPIEEMTQVDKAAPTIEWWAPQEQGRTLIPVTIYSGGKIVANVGQLWYEYFDSPPVGHWCIIWETGMVTFRDPESFAKDFDHVEGNRYHTAGRPLFTY